MSRTGFVAVVIGNYLVAIFFSVMGVLVLAGAGWGEGTLVQRIIIGLIAIVLGGLSLVGATIRLAEGRAGGQPAEGVRVARSGPFWAGAGVEGGSSVAGFGIGYPEGRRDGSGTHPGIGEF